MLAKAWWILFLLLDADVCWKQCKQKCLLSNVMKGNIIGTYGVILLWKFNADNMPWKNEKLFKHAFVVSIFKKRYTYNRVLTKLLGAIVEGPNSHRLHRDVWIYLLNKQKMNSWMLMRLCNKKPVYLVFFVSFYLTYFDFGFKNNTV